MREDDAVAITDPLRRRSLSRRRLYKRGTVVRKTVDLWQEPRVAQAHVGPGANIVCGHIGAHATHPASAFFRGHLHGLIHRIGHAFGVVGIDDQGVRQFFSRAGHMAYEQHALFFDLTGDIFLRDQIHPIVDRTHEGQVCHPVIRGEGIEPDASLTELNRPPT